ncbi:MAG: hypothetical protein AAB019_02175 [Planctomycetota bacterium]
MAFKKHIFICLYLGLTVFGCQGISSKPLPVGLVKISYFAQTETRRTNQLVGVYIAVVSQKWYQQHRQKLYEIFEEAAPASVHIAPDEIMDQLITYCQEKGFYRLPAMPLGEFKTSDLTRRDFQIKVITLEINGISRSVSLDKLTKPEEQFVFRELREVIRQVFNASSGPAVITLEQVKPEEIQQREK